MPNVLPLTYYITDMLENSAVDLMFWVNLFKSVQRVPGLTILNMPDVIYKNNVLMFLLFCVKGIYISYHISSFKAVLHLHGVRTFILCHKGT